MDNLDVYLYCSMYLELGTHKFNKFERHNTNQHYMKTLKLRNYDKESSPP